jgi:hypothetical protein
MCTKLGLTRIEENRQTILTKVDLVCFEFLGAEYIAERYGACENFEEDSVACAWKRPHVDLDVDAVFVGQQQGP